MASQQLANFCKVVIRDVYGDMASQVVGALFDSGRLTTQQLAKKTKLPVLTVQRTLIALVQNRFVTYWTDKSGARASDRSNGVGITHYMANWREIYAVLWSGPIFEQITQIYSGDPHVLQAVKNFHVYGHMRVKDYLSSLSSVALLSVGIKTEDGIKLEHDELEHGDSYEKKTIQNALSTLVSHKILIPLKAYDFCSEPDLYQQYLLRAKKDIAQNGQTLSETAKQNTAEAKAKNDVEQLLQEKYLPGVGLCSKSGSAIRKGSVDLLNQDISDLEVDEEAVLAINHERFLLNERNKELIKFCSDRLGPMTANVFKCILQCYEQKLHSCDQQVHFNDKYKISTLEIAKKLDKLWNLSASFHDSLHKRRPSPQENGGYSRSKRIKTEDGGHVLVGDNTYNSNNNISNVIDLSDEDEDENNSDHDMSTPTSSSSGNSPYGALGGSYQSLKQHLEMLSSCSVPFLRRPENGTPDTWWVPFGELCDALKRHAYDRIIEQRYGHLCSRILRVVKEQQKVAEPVLSRISLVNSVELRSCLAKLEYIGCLDLQEVSRGNDRAPSRTFYFWYHSPRRAYTLLLENMYNTMLNLYTLLLAERMNNSVLLSKIEREDVKGNEEAYLSAQEKTELNDLKKREECILTQIFRLDSMVRIFRDY